MAYNDIKIVTLDTSRTKESEKGFAMRHLYLKLSDTPNADWSSLFESERGFPRHSMWRRAWTEGSYIVIDCPPEELEKHHLEDLKKDVTNTNHKYELEREKWLAQKKIDEDAETAERKNLDDLKGRLNFD